MEELVIQQNNQAVTTSLKVAETYGKTHKNVLRAIKALLTSAQTCANLFVEGTYLDKYNRPTKMFYMNRDGYTLLVMGFEGKDALSFKLAYMNAFNAMEKIIKEQQTKELAKPANPLDVIQAMLDNLRSQDTRILNVEKRLDDMDKQREESVRELLALPVSNDKPVEITLRKRASMLVVAFAEASNVPFNDVWHRVYHELYWRYTIRITGKGYESKIAEAEAREKSCEALTKIITIISNLIKTEQPQLAKKFIL